MKKLLSLLIILAFLLAQNGSGNALDFDGTNDYVDVAASGTLRPTTAVSVEAWVNADSYTQWHSILSYAVDNGTTESGIDFGYVNGQLRFRVARVGMAGDEWNTDAGAVVPTGQWFHIAGTYDGTTIRVYLNGVEAASVSRSGNINWSPAPEDLRIGMFHDSNEDNYFDGRIDEVRYWNTALSESTIRDWMVRSVTASHPNYANLQSYWKLDETAGTSASDSRGSNTGTLTNMTNADWIQSAAAIGDSSVNNYSSPSSISLAHGDGDQLTVNSITGSPSGVHVYYRSAAPSNMTAPSGFNKLDSLRYWGVFVVGGTSPTYSAIYNYNGHPGVGNGSTLLLAERDDASDNTWANASATLNTGTNTLTETGINQQDIEYVLGTSSATITLNNEPSAQATNLQLTGATASTINVSYTASASAQGYVVFRRAGSAPTDVPQDGTTYTAGATVGDATVAFSGTGLSFTDGGLNSGTTYHYAVYAYSSSGSYINYRTSDALSGSQSTSASGMTYSSSTTRQNTNIVVPGSTEETIVGIEVVVTGDQSPLNISQMYLNTTGTTSSSDIQNAKLWYTGTTNPFAGREFSKMKSKVSWSRPDENISIQNDLKYNYHIDQFVKINENNIASRSKAPDGSTQYGSTISSPSGVMTFSGSQTLSQGTNYFWLTYDIVPGATITNVVDAQFDSLIIGSTTHTPVTAAPAGSRSIQSYSTSQSNNFNYEHVTNVTFSNINNSSVGSYYTDYTALSPAVVYRNNSYDLDVSIKVDVQGYIRAWVDWNNDGDFTDSGEQYTLATNSSSAGPHTASISVPATANLGETRMRVTLKYGSHATSIETFTYGEVEDYKIDVRQAVNMSYQSSTTSQNTNYVGRNTTNQQVIGLQVVTSGIDNPLSLSQINLNTTGTSSTSDISNAKIFYTGTSPDFATGTQFGSTLASPSGSFSISGSATLSSGTNYFWLTYDVPSGATLNNVIDGQVASFVLNSVTRTPSTTAPAGSRQIRRVYNISTTTVTDNDGILYDDGGADNNYGASTNRIFTISPTSADYVTIQFRKFRYENQVSPANTDYIYVYDGPNTGSAQISGSPFTGTTLPNSGDLITSSSGSITIRQTSTANTFESGFELEFIGYQNNNMAYSSSTVTQNTNVVGIGFTNQHILGVEVVTTGNQNAINLTALAASTNGTDASYISNARLYYTGASSTFATTTQVGSTVASPSGTFNFSGTQALATGTNYFWITYDISASAPSEQAIDASVTQVTVGGSSHTPSTTSPSGSRTTKIVEGFEGSFPPTNWTRAVTSGSTNWSQSTSIAYNGSRSAEAARAQATRFLISPQVRPTNSDNTLRLWVRKHAAAGSNEGTLYIRISTSTNATASFSTTVTQYLVNSFTTNWEEKVIDLSAYNNQAIYVAFIHENASGSDGGCFIDDIALPAEIQDITYTDISLSNLALADNQDNVQVLRFVSSSQSNYTLNSVQLTNTVSGAIGEVSALRLYKKRGATTNLVSTIANPTSTQTFSSLSETIQNNDTLYVEADFADFDYTNAYNFVVSNLSHVTNGSGQTVTNVNFPLSSRTVTYTFVYTITASNASPSPSFSNNSRSWMGYISFTEFGSANPVNINVNSITIQNRLASGVSGVVSASDIDSVYIYYGTATSPNLSTEPTAKADWVDDGNGGNATVTFSPSVAASGIGVRFHIVYKMSSSITLSNKIGLRISSVGMDNPASPNTPETNFSIDITLPVTISTFNAKDSENAVKISLITSSEPDLSVLRIVREEIETGKKEIVSEFETSGSVSHGREYNILDNTADFGVAYKYIVYESLTNGSWLEQASFNYLRKSPANFAVSRAYPNPFNPVTNIKITLPEKSDINIRIYNVLGQLIREMKLFNVALGYKEISWDATNRFGGKVASGMYFIQINVSSVSSEKSLQKIQKLVLLK